MRLYLGRSHERLFTSPFMGEAGRGAVPASNRYAATRATAVAGCWNTSFT
jgi:hypothetical protein